MFGYDIAVVVSAFPWLALAVWVTNSEEAASRGKFLLSVVWGAVFTVVFFFALSITTAPLPINLVGYIVTWVIGIAAIVSPFIALWRGAKLVFRRARAPRETNVELTASAKEVLGVTRRLMGSGQSVQPEDTVRHALRAAGYGVVSENDLAICLWPDRTAAVVAEGFFGAGCPLARLQGQHVRGKWAALGAFNAAKMALLVGLADGVTAEQHALALAWNVQHGGPAFSSMYAASEADVSEMRARAIADPVATYTASIYLRSLLRNDAVDRYFPAESDAEHAVAEAKSRIDAARDALVQLTLRPG